MRSTFAWLALVLAGCSSGTDTPDLARLPVVPLGAAARKDTAGPARAMPPAPATAEAPIPAPAGWPAPFAPAGGSPCTRVARQAATIRTRPAAGAGQFGQLAVGDHVRLAARTADGWVGFDPGTAQAANVGIFRLRWVRASEAFAPGDSCAQLPLVAAPPAGCVLMAARAVPVHPHPAPGTALLSTIPAGSYAQVVKAAVGPDKWAEVVVPGSAVHGYVAAADANFSGPCQY